jgi:hypothetical protein
MEFVATLPYIHTYILYNNQSIHKQEDMPDLNIKIVLGAAHIR